MNEEISHIYGYLESELNAVRTLISAEIRTRNKSIQMINEDILKSKGKLIRPALVLLSGKAASRSRSTKKLRIFASIIELLHNLSLIHDDIVDGDQTRRNQDALSVRWRNRIAILSGDYLYAKAFKLLNELFDRKLILAVTGMTDTMCQGEILSIESEGDASLKEKQYLQIIRMMTASLFSVCCYGAGIIQKADKRKCEVLRQYGLNFGTMYQIKDDWIDLEDDLKARRITLPVIYLLQDLAKKKNCHTYRALDFKRGAFNSKRAKSLIYEFEIKKRIQRKLNTLAGNTRSLLKAFPDSPPKDYLIDLVELLKKLD